MSDQNLETNPRLEEPTKPESSESQVLEEATHTPGSRVEQSQNFASAEAIEAELVGSINQRESHTAPEEDITGPQKLGQDPLTGQETGSGSQQGSTPQSEEAALAEGELDDHQISGDAVFEDASRQPEAGGDASDGTVVLDPAPEGAVIEPDFSDPELSQTAAGDVDKNRLTPEDLPIERQLPVGFGRDGAIFPAGKEFPQHEGYSTDPKAKSGPSTSGGGLPVNIPGGKSSGKSKKSKGTEGESFHSGSSSSGRWLFLKASESGKGYVEEPDGKGVWVQDKDGDWWYQEVDEEDPPVDVPKQGDPIDGDFGTPYTGSGGGSGEHPDPDVPIGGLDRESGHVFPVLEGDGGQEGGRTPGDKDGEDDSGHFLGDPYLVPHDDYVPPPDDDIPYNKLDRVNARDDEVQESNLRKDPRE